MSKNKQPSNSKELVKVDFFFMWGNTEVSQANFFFVRNFKSVCLSFFLDHDIAYDQWLKTCMKHRAPRCRFSSLEKTTCLQRGENLAFCRLFYSEIWVRSHYPENEASSRQRVLEAHSEHQSSGSVIFCTDAVACPGFCADLSLGQILKRCERAASELIW